MAEPASTGALAVGIAGARIGAISAGSSGERKLKKGKLVEGVGVNDADYVIQRIERVAGKRAQAWCCPFYVAWSNMLMRCYSSKYQSRNPSYVGCSVVPEWHSFMAFRAWAMQQDHEGKHLDKDILFPGNKVYSPSTCVFVEPALNLFLGDRARARGEYPAGVRLNKKTGRFEARCNNPFTGVRETIGSFDLPEQAYLAWRRRKRDLAHQWAEIQKDPRVSSALRSRYA